MSFKDYYLLSVLLYSNTQYCRIAGGIISTKMRKLHWQSCSSYFVSTVICKDNCSNNKWIYERKYIFYERIWERDLGASQYISYNYLNCGEFPSKLCFAHFEIIFAVIYCIEFRQIQKGWVRKDCVSNNKNKLFSEEQMFTIKKNSFQQQICHSVFIYFHLISY